MSDEKLELTTKEAMALARLPGTTVKCDGRDFAQLVAYIEKVEAALAAEQAGAVALREALATMRDALRMPDNGYHHCRSCDAKSPAWEHSYACRIELERAQIEAAKTACDAALSGTAGRALAAEVAALRGVAEAARIHWLTCSPSARAWTATEQALANALDALRKGAP